MTLATWDKESSKYFFLSHTLSQYFFLSLFLLSQSFCPNYFCAKFFLWGQKQRRFSFGWSVESHLLKDWKLLSSSLSSMIALLKWLMKSKDICSHSGHKVDQKKYYLKKSNYVQIRKWHSAIKSISSGDKRVDFFSLKLSSWKMKRKIWLCHLCNFGGWKWNM